MWLRDDFLKKYLSSLTRYSYNKKKKQQNKSDVLYGNLIKKNKQENKLFRRQIGLYYKFLGKSEEY